MKTMSPKELDLFKNFNEKLSLKDNDIKILNTVNHESIQMLQILTYHLAFEYFIETWINYKINEGKPTFKGIDKIGFHNKLYIAKNIGLPITLFSLIDTINQERNKFAHDITKTELSRKEILKIGDLSNKVTSTGANYETLYILSPNKGRINSTTECNQTLLYFVLQASLRKLRNFIFEDIFESNSKNI